MKILTKEEEDAHYNATLKGGISGGLIGLAVGTTAVLGLSRRYAVFRSLTLPMKTFLATSTGTFTAIIQADKSSRNFQNTRNPENFYRDEASLDRAALKSNETGFQRFKEWGRENRYPIVTASWVASLGIALGIVGRSPYLTRAQKLVQARVYAQGLTLAILIATAAFEVGDASKGSGRWETVKIIDPNDPEHKHMIEKRIHHEAYEGEDLWRDMVATEERKIKAREEAAAAEHEKFASKSDHKSDHSSKATTKSTS
ncbi:hypothetical protein VTL71DRAFT_5082 [Oculimacula yallundae]|uniref:HIG1 domain-containing protein n=1 Tax=Oculimacula yallundae TaxID=86028 RepID=A0ABR4C072_9HELO